MFFAFFKSYKVFVFDKTPYLPFTTVAREKHLG